MKMAVYVLTISAITCQGSRGRLFRRPGTHVYYSWTQLFQSKDSTYALFCLGMHKITDCLQPQIHKYVSACQSIGRRTYAHRPVKQLANQR
jgi:hypothetical protein